MFGLLFHQFKLFQLSITEWIIMVGVSPVDNTQAPSSNALSQVLKNIHKTSSNSYLHPNLYGAKPQTVLDKRTSYTIEQRDLYIRFRSSNGT